MMQLKGFIVAWNWGIDISQPKLCNNSMFALSVQSIYDNMAYFVTVGGVDASWIFPVYHFFPWKKIKKCFCIKSSQEKLSCWNRNGESGIGKGGSCLLFDLTVLIPGLITSTISDSAVTMVLMWCLLTAVRGKRERQAQMSFHEVLSLELWRQIPRGANAQISLQTAVYHLRAHCFLRHGAKQDTRKLTKLKFYSYLINNWSKL